ncbi:MAG: DNA gyrase modulator, partial [Acidobacteriota bacterium]|nr:DNA gyrase modulator [Acidobacteriota bacterium]
MDKLCRIAVDAAINAGASYADARFVSRREESVETKNGSVDGVTSSTDRGIGVRVIAGGAWGFAATSELTESALADAARKAVEIGKAGAPTLEEPVT